VLLYVMTFDVVTFTIGLWRTASTGDRAWNGAALGSICLLCILVFSKFNAHASVFNAFSWVAGVVLSFYFATSSIDKGLDYLATARKPSPSAALPAIPSAQPSAHPTGDRE
jgi:hypothetical protein